MMLAGTDNTPHCVLADGDSGGFYGQVFDRLLRN
jgi:hypothetical protein